MLIEGDFVDAYLYGGLLLAWDRRGRLMIASTEALASATANAISAPRGVARAAFVDNKLFNDSDALRLARRSAVSRVHNGDGAVTHLRLDDIQPEFFDVASDAHVLDLMATYSRLFISTDDSLLTVPFAAGAVGDVQRRLAHRCLSTTPRWGAVSASCASAGAWALLNEIETVAGRQRRTEQIDAGVSVRHSWLGSSLLSFDEESQIDLFKASVRRKKGEPYLVEGFSPLEEYGEHSDIDWLSSDDPLGLGDADFVTTFTGLLVLARDGWLEATMVSTWSGFPEPIGEVEELPAAEGRVLAIADTDAGFVVETDDELTYVSTEGPLKLLERETISLRSYPRSRRHRRSVTATVEGGLLIAALLGVHPMPHDERRIGPPGR